MTNDRQELARAVYQQLMEQIRKQDDLVQSWTKYYLSIQAALAIAMSFLVNLKASQGSQPVLLSAGSLFLPLLGVVTTVCLTNIIMREKLWQGRYVAQVRKLQKDPGAPETYSEDWSPADPNPKERGYISRQFARLRWALVVGWSLWALVSLPSALRGLGVNLEATTLSVNFSRLPFWGLVLNGLGVGVLALVTVRVALDDDGNLALRSWVSERVYRRLGPAWGNRVLGAFHVTGWVLLFAGFVLQALAVA